MRRKKPIQTSSHTYTHRVKNPQCWRIYSLYCCVLLLRADENGHLIISTMIKALKSMWEQEKGREVGLTQSKKQWCESGLTFTSCWQRDRSGSSLWTVLAVLPEWRAGGGREVCVVGIVNHACSVLARSGVDYVCQALASLAVWEGLGIVLA